MTIPDRQAGETARSYALRVLLYNITTLELAPGNAVSENELSALMQLSRTPVREALIELAKSDLVEILPQRGSYITKIDYGLIEESRFARIVLETAILKLACEQGISEEFLARIEENLAQERAQSNSENTTIQLELDNQFHQLFFEAVNKRRTFELVRSQMVHFDRLRSLTLRSLSIQDTRTIEDHENILYAVRRRDSDLAEMLIKRHLTRFQVEKSQLMHQYPEYFLM